MVNALHGTRPQQVSGELPPPQPTDLDWRIVADQRLSRLVEIEHDQAVMRDRLDLLQVDYRTVLVANAEQLRRIHEQGNERTKLERRLADLAYERDSMRASFQHSRSWRLTRPLRTVSSWARAVRRRGAGGGLRAMLRIRWVRRLGRFAVRRIPGMHDRLRAKLYPGAGDVDRKGNLVDRG